MAPSTRAPLAPVTAGRLPGLAHRASLASQAKAIASTQSAGVPNALVVANDIFPNAAAMRVNELPFCEKNGGHSTTQTDRQAGGAR